MPNQQNLETHNQITSIENRAARKAASQMATRANRPTTASSAGGASQMIGMKDPVTKRTLRPAISGVDGPETPGVYLSVTGQRSRRGR